MLYILSCFLGSLLVRFLLPLICTLLRVAHAPGVPLLPFLYSLLQSSFHPSVSSPSGFHSPIPILKPMGILISCFSLFLLCPCPYLVYCLQAFSVVVLDLMTCPRCRPFFLFPIVSAFFPCCVVVFLHCVLGLSTCFPQEGRLHQYPRLRLMVGSLGLFPRHQIPMLMLTMLKSMVFFVRSHLVS
jgi:hypothetical protein